MLRTALASLLVVLSVAGPAAAAPLAVPFAEQNYVNNFVDHWKNTLGKQNTIVMGVLLVGALGIFIITRGKKLK